MDASKFAEAAETDRRRYYEYLRNLDGGPSETCDDCGASGRLSEVMVRGGFIKDLCPDCARDADEV